MYDGEKKIVRFSWENQKTREHLEEEDADEREILQWIRKKQWERVD